MPSSSIPDIETVVIGAGVIGLAIAAECANTGQETYVLERRHTIGQEVSSRSSEVVHAGIYYPPKSLKARMCVDGKRLLYAYARDKHVAIRQLGKLIVATSPAEAAALEAIAGNAKANGVDDLRVLSASEVQALEPEIACVKALFSPSTGIVDSHGLMRAFEADLAFRGGTVVLNTEVRSVTRRSDGLFEIETTSGGETAKITARNLFVAAELGMAELGNVLPRTGSYAPPRLYFAKGHYFTLHGRQPFHHLVYPVPVDGGLGTHLTLDMDGRARFGPDVEWVDHIDYAFEDIDGSRRADFEKSIRRYWPGLPDGALEQNYTAIRPKTSRQGEAARDFEIHGPLDHGVPRLVALYGIESPGLTSSLAIARYCAALLHES